MCDDPAPDLSSSSDSFGSSFSGAIAAVAVVLPCVAVFECDGTDGVAAGIGSGSASGAGAAGTAGGVGAVGVGGVGGNVAASRAASGVASGFGVATAALPQLSRAVSRQTSDAIGDASVAGVIKEALGLMIDWRRIWFGKEKVTIALRYVGERTHCVCCRL
jgi:hypothetical protein